MPPKPVSDPPEVAARIEEAMPLVDVIARQIARQIGAGINLDDLASAGREALFHAARAFDETKGVPFKRWANLRIRGGVMDAVRTSSNIPRRVGARLAALEASDRMQEAYLEEDQTKPSASEADADSRLAAYLAGMATAMAVGLVARAARGESDDVTDAHDPQPSPEEQAAAREVSERLQRALDALPAAERKLLRAHYFEGRTFDEAAASIGLSKSWASRLHARAIESLGKTLDLRLADG